MVIDWESSHLTKNAHKYTAIEEAGRKYNNHDMTLDEYTHFMDACRKVGLVK